jgi:hypothetical protein
MRWASRGKWVDMKVVTGRIYPKSGLNSNLYILLKIIFASQIALLLDPLFIEPCTWVAGSVALREQLQYR